MFKIKSADEISKMTDAEAMQYKDDFNAYVKSLETDLGAVKTAGTETAETIKGLETKLNDFQTKLEEAEKVIKAQGVEIEKAKTTEIAPVDANKAFKEAAEMLIKNVETRSPEKVQIKVADMLTTTHVTGTGVQPFRLQSPTMPRLSPALMFNYCNVWNQPEGFVDDVAFTESGDADETAEGIAKNQMDGSLNGIMYAMQNVNAFITISRKMLSNLPYIQNLIQNRLLQKVMLKASNKILLGTGNGTTGIKGAMEFAQNFSAGDFAGAYEAPTLYHVLIVALAQAKNSEYMPNAIFLTPSAVAQLRLDAFEKNIPMPELYLQNGILYVGGVPIVETTQITSDQFALGDFTLSNVAIQNAYQVFVDPYTGLKSNKVTILGEMDLLHYISATDVNAFVKGDITDSIALLTKENA